MREVDRLISRRSFLRRAAIGAGMVSASLVVGDAMLEELGRLFPRRLFAGGFGAMSYEGDFRFVPGEDAVYVCVVRGTPGTWKKARALHGDGVHDDAPGLNAVLNGADAFDLKQRKLIEGSTGVVQLGRGQYAVGSTVQMSGRGFVVDSMHLKGLPELGHAPALRVLDRGGRPNIITRCYIESAEEVRV